MILPLHHSFGKEMRSMWGIRALLVLFEISESYIILLNSFIHWIVFSPASMVVGVCRSLSLLLWDCKVQSWQVGSLLQGHIERQTTMCSRTYTHSQIRVWICLKCLNFNRYACDIDLIQKALFSLNRITNKNRHVWPYNHFLIFEAHFHWDIFINLLLI